MKRREFIALLGAAAWPLAARVEQAMTVIGFVQQRDNEIAVYHQQ
jgi:hypothetical protein